MTLDLTHGDAVALTEALCNIESVSRNEATDRGRPSRPRCAGSGTSR